MTNLFNFSYSAPTRILFGEQQIAAIKTHIPTSATVLLVYGGGSIMRNGIYQQVKDALRGLSLLEFGGITANPEYSLLNLAVDLARNNNVDFVLAVGGGSVMDGAKYIAAAICYKGDGWDLVTRHQPVHSALPLGTIATLSATGSESNNIAVISRRDQQEKLAFSSPHLVPVFAVLDPTLLKTLPEHQLANGLVDAFVHVTEQYLTYPANGMVQDGYAETLMRTLYQLACTFDQRHTTAWLQNLMWAANQALNGLISVGMPVDFATHAISVELTALYGIDHARTLSILQPTLLRETTPEKEAKLKQLGSKVFGLDSPTAFDAISAIETLYRQLDMPLHLHHEGVRDIDASSKVMAGLKRRQISSLGENEILDLPRIERILRLACQ